MYARLSISNSVATIVHNRPSSNDKLLIKISPKPYPAKIIKSSDPNGYGG